MLRRSLALLGAVVVSSPALAVPLFGPASPVNPHNTPSADQLTDLTVDGLTAVLQSNVGGKFNIYQSTRPTTSSPWGAPSDTFYSALNSVPTNTGHAVMRDDGLELIYQENPDTYRATRPNTSVPFSAGVLETALSSGFVYTRPGWISNDGLRLYMEAFDGVRVNLYVANRASTTSPWSTPSQGPFLANVNSSSANDAEPFLTNDELELYFLSDRPGGAGGADIWWASRPDTTSPFSVPVNVASVNTPSTEGSPELFGDVLYFRSNRAGGTWGTTQDVWAATIIPEPATVGLVGLASLLIGRRRRA
jgi:hypothetical protein